MKQTQIQLVVLYAGFVASGIGCALPGALLPTLLTSWHWSDSHAGSMFLVIAAASATAPLLLRGVLRAGIALGHLLAALGTLMWALHDMSPVFASVFFGLGLGLVMTGINLWFARRHPGRSQALARLNVVWALGAFSCPVLMTHALRINSPRGVLLMVSAGFATLAVISWSIVQPGPPIASRKVAIDVRGIPLSLLAAAALATGVEASCGAWLASYAQRSQHQLESTLLASTCFWAGLLVSRALSSLPSKNHLRHLPVAWLAALTTTATILVLLPQCIALLPIAAFLLGSGLGPLFPELLARALALRENTGIFFLAGALSAAMPCAAGVLSTASGSLRIGLLIPLLGSVCLLLCSLLAPRWKTFLPNTDLP